MREVLESIVIPPIPNVPFTATLATEATKYTADGTSMTFVNERRIARDAQGRLYQERWYLVPKGGNVKSTMNWIQIEDPKQRTLYNCSTQKHICDRLVWDFARNLAAANPPKGRSGPLPDGGERPMGGTRRQEYCRRRDGRLAGNHHPQRWDHGQRSTAFQHARVLAFGPAGYQSHFHSHESRIW